MKNNDKHGMVSTSEGLTDACSELQTNDAAGVSVWKRRGQSPKEAGCD